jgi:hypothetical protein
MSLAAYLLVLVGVLPGARKLARRAWCAQQRDWLRLRAPRVRWVHDGQRMPWALWGAENHFFELDWANGLPYLRAAATVR